MSIIDNVERYMKRYDYLIQKREKQYNKGKRLSQEEDEELRRLKPNVITPIVVMFEVLHDTIKRNQTIRNQNKHIQTGGATSPSAVAIAAVAAAEASASAPGAAAGAKKMDLVAIKTRKTKATMKPNVYPNLKNPFFLSLQKLLYTSNRIKTKIKRKKKRFFKFG